MTDQTSSTSTQAAQASPRPWYVTNTSNDQGLIVSESDGRNIAVCYDKNDAPLIVEAVNTFDANQATIAAQAETIWRMREALEYVQKSEIHGNAYQARKLIRAALEG